jgi:hypothetical protein
MFSASSARPLSNSPQNGGPVAPISRLGLFWFHSIDLRIAAGKTDGGIGKCSRLAVRRSRQSSPGGGKLVSNRHFYRDLAARNNACRYRPPKSSYSDDAMPLEGGYRADERTHGPHGCRCRGVNSQESGRHDGVRRLSLRPPDQPNPSHAEGKEGARTWPRQQPPVAND